MYSTMNRELGTKWFTFFTKVRPWIVVLSVVRLLVEFIAYPGFYLRQWWALLYFCITIAGCVLAMITMVKSKSSDYGAFVSFVKKVLVFDMISIPYQRAATEYAVSYDIVTALAVMAGGILFSYFIWYRPNVKYFERRIVHAGSVENMYNMNYAYNENIGYEMNNNQNANNTYNAYATYDTEETINLDKVSNAPSYGAYDETVLLDANSQPRFCMRCGHQLQPNAVYCEVCGKKIQREINVE